MDTCRLCKKETATGFYEKTTHRYKDRTYVYRRWVCTPCNREKARKYRSTESGRKKTLEHVKRSIKKHRHKQKARWRVRDALISGKLVKPNCCECCNKQKPLEGHHEDYTKPLEVVWLCRPCHNEADKDMV